MLRRLCQDRKLIQSAALHSLAVALVSLAGSVCSGAEPASCLPLPEGKQKLLVNYVREKYKLSDSVSINLAADLPITGTCFHQLTFQGRSTLKTWELKLYLSPDGRYLTSDLLDTTVDPVEEEHRKMQALMDGLSENKGASFGPEHAPVTIVEFSDFECPYCRKFANILREVIPAEGDRIRVVFHHMPLSMHPWARVAAEGAACAQLQNSKAFWAFHDELFREQSEITAENAKVKVTRVAQTIPGLDFSEFQTCVENEMSLGLVLRDINLATSNQINATPTLFINGHRLQGVKDAAQLREIIAEATKETAGESEKSPLAISGGAAASICKR